MKKHLVVFLVFLCAILLASCSQQQPEPGQQQNESSSATYQKKNIYLSDEEQVASELVGRVKMSFYSDSSFGLWDDITFISYACLADEDESKTLDDGTKVAQYLIIPFAATDEDGLSKYELCYWTEWGKSNCNTTAVNCIKLNGDETIYNQDLTDRYYLYKDKEEEIDVVTISKGRIKTIIDIKSYSEDDFISSEIGSGHSNAESSTGNPVPQTTTNNRVSYESLTNADKKAICDYIQSRYNHYDEVNGGYAGDKYSDTIYQEAADKYGLTTEQIGIIWSNSYSYGSPATTETNTARHDETTIKVCSKDIVTSYLSSPSTANFCPYSEMKTQDLGNGHYQCTGWVDCQNAYGATVRYDFVAYYTATEKGYKEGEAQLFPRN